MCPAGPSRCISRERIQRHVAIVFLRVTPTPMALSPKRQLGAPYAHALTRTDEFLQTRELR